MSETKVAILGLGIIGEAWAKNLEADGVPLALWNRTKKDRPHVVAEAADAARGATHVIVVVSDASAVGGVIDAIVPVLKPGQIVIQSSTITPEAVHEAEAKVRATGASFLDCPFTGSKPAAEKRETVYYIGGDDAVIEAARPVLQRLSKAILPIGGIGAASALKLAMNLNIAGVAQTLCESLSLARSAGIADEVYFSALKLNVSNSGIVALKERLIREEDFAPQFSLKHMYKDLRQAKTVAGRRHFPLLERLLEVYEAGTGRGFSDDDFISLIRLLERPKV
ncbi:3-hydroxyisobutyrate dehydrogenase [Verrucomicrobium sp. GAS474]|uniref:NAD(P)-dependent oxidoreductase n=1 Tax=Verrucomicrobium sp. GAS474 TaxID=1882831 RepID=UPI00087A6A63|nr:NAD(P)-dependent oxidoreductase [Verrucomicrobium sp. GAS474]SDU23031.1 3-hydroxyisobutyrate dehydrogenase [Verrucomicrobium sp. GAS474]